MTSDDGRIRLEYMLDNDIIYMKIHALDGMTIDINSDNITFPEEIPMFQMQDVIINSGVDRQIVYANISPHLTNGIHVESSYFTNPTNIRVRTSYVAFRRI